MVVDHRGGSGHECQPGRHVQVEVAGLGHPERRAREKERGDVGELRHTPTE